MSKPYNVNTKIRSALRQVWRWSPMRRDALKRAWVERGKYRCAHCGDLFGPKDVAVDHITPCGNIDDLNGFVARLFCAPEGLQILCKAKCHKNKTAAERQARLRARKKAE